MDLTDDCDNSRMKSNFFNLAMSPLAGLSICIDLVDRKARANLMLKRDKLHTKCSNYFTFMKLVVALLKLHFSV